MDSPFDRGEVDRASLDATERLRARLSGRPVEAPAARRPAILPWVFAGGLFVFATGMIANPWFESRVRQQLPFAASTAGDSSEVTALRNRLAALEARGAASASAAPMPAERLARTEARIETSTDQIAREADRIDRLASEVAGLAATRAADRASTETATATAIAAAERAEAMLTLVLVRRAIDAGRPLGALDAPLRRAFEPRYPDAVKAVAALGAAPVTLASLQRDHDRLQAALGSGTGGARQSWWDTLTGTVAKAVSGDATPGLPEAARAALARGDYLAAANQLRRLPGPRPAALSAWLAAAERLQAGNQGLAVLETAAILPPAPPAAPATAVIAAPPAPAAAPLAENRRIDSGGSRVERVLVSLRRAFVPNLRQFRLG